MQKSDPTSKGARGIYLWTNIVSDKQYVGSSKNLYSRLEDYFQNSQLISQVKNSNSTICKALLKYGHSSFSLQILLVETSTDILALEQSYLDKYDLQYNIRRSATGSSTEGEAPSLIKKVEVFVYDITKQVLLAYFESVNNFQSFSGLNGSQIKILLKSEEKLWRNAYFISGFLLIEADNTMSNKPFVPVKQIGQKLTYSVYVYKLGEIEPLNFESQAKCAKALGLSAHGIGKAILNNSLYNGYRFSRFTLNKPFDN